VRVFASAAARRRFLLHAAVAVCLVVGVVVLVRDRLSVVTDAATLRAYVRGFGALAPLVLIGLQALQVVVAPVPGQVLAAVAGYLFGPWWGTLYNMLGIALGSTVAFWLSRRYGRAYVERTVDSQALSTFDTFVQRRGLLALFVLFLIPGLPDDVICFLGGLTPIPLRKLVLVAIVGRAPAFFLVNVAGALVASGNLRAAGVLLAVVALLALVGYRYRDRVASGLDDWLS
jgi:uncharacterized membrane protein YdjX (TVP38/TMEM64 family)